MKKTELLYKKIKKNRLIALLTPKTPEQCLVAYEVFSPLGITLEIAFRSKAALDGIKAVIKRHPDALILAGTVMTRAQAEHAIKAGASGIVSADYIPAVVDACARADIMCIPGGLTDAGKQLVQKAEVYGCELEELKEKYPYQWIYKLFPAATETKSNLDFASSWKGPYKDLAVVYAGGVSFKNLAEMAARDSAGVFCGSALTDKIENPEKMKEEAEKWLEVIHGSKNRKEERALKKIEKKKPPCIPKVVTFGEILLRLSPPNSLRFAQTKAFEATFGGAEANVAVSLANYGLESCFVTALPDHEIGQAALNHLRMFNVDTRYILRQGKRVGIYFLEGGASQRPSKVIYDRQGSSISEVKPGIFDWEKIFERTTWFHWSGITPALSDSSAETVAEAIKFAKKAGLTVSVDLNYRKKLWPPQRARTIMTALMADVDIAFGNEEDASEIFGIKPKASKPGLGKLKINDYRTIAQEMAKRFGLKKVGITLRESLSASINIWSGCLFNGQDFYQSRKYKIQVLDRIGAGDAFSAGFIYASLAGRTDVEALEFATAASCLKHTIHGDFNLVSLKEVEALAWGEASGRVQR